MAPSTTNSAQLSSDDAGFSLIEMVVALSIFVLIAAGVAETLSQTLDITRTNRNRVIAAAIAASYEESLRSTLFTSIPLGETTFTCGPSSLPICLAGAESGVAGVDGTTYTIVQDITAVPGPNSPPSCTHSNSGTDASYLDVSIDVTWPGVTGTVGTGQVGSITQPVHTESLIAPSPNVIKGGTGNIAFQVVGANQLPMQNLPITLASGTSSETIDTTATGCAYFAFLAPGTYSVSAPGYIDTSELLVVPGVAPSQTVVAGKTTQVDETWALSASVRLRYTRNAVLPASEFPYSLRDNSGSSVYNPTINPVPLFPFPEGYSVWGGNCADSEPPMPAIINPTPGPTTNTDVDLPTANITSSLPFSTVMITHAPDNSCALQHYSYRLGAPTRSVAIALPYGTWIIQPNGQQARSVIISGTTNSPLPW